MATAARESVYEVRVTYADGMTDIWWVPTVDDAVADAHESLRDSEIVAVESLRDGRVFRSETR